MSEQITHTEYRKFRRTPDDRMVAGVCGGLARLLGVDTVLVRVGVVAATLLGFFAPALVVYLACWLVVPEE